MEEFLRKLGITKKGSTTPEGLYVIDLTEDEWAKYFSKLDRSNLVDEDEDSSNLGYESSVNQFENEDYIITLIGDLDEEKYKLTIKER